MRQYARQCPSGGTETCDPTGRTAGPTEASHEGGKQKSGKATAAATCAGTAGAAGSTSLSSVEAGGSPAGVEVSSSEGTAKSKTAAAPLKSRNRLRAAATGGLAGPAAPFGSMTVLLSSAADRGGDFKEFLTLRSFGRWRTCGAVLGSTVAGAPRSRDASFWDSVSSLSLSKFSKHDLPAEVDGEAGLA